MIFMLKSHIQLNFSQFDFDFDNICARDFQAIKTQLKISPRPLQRR